MGSTTSYDLARAHADLGTLGWRMVPEGAGLMPGALALFERYTRCGLPTRAALVSHGGALVLEPLPEGD